MADVRRSTRSGQATVSQAAHLDWTNADEVRRTLSELRVAFDDVDLLVKDMLRGPRERELGPALHRQNYDDARGSVVQLLAFATPLDHVER